MKPIICAVDFDGTVVTHEYPEDGSRPYVDWEKVHEILVMTDILTEPVPGIPFRFS